MNRSGIFFLIGAIIFFVVTTWLNSQWISFKYFQLTQKEKQIDYYLSNFTLLKVQESGEMQYFVTGQHLIHQQNTGSSEIFNPVLEARNTDGTITSLVARKAVQVKKNGEIQLQGTVIVKKEADNKNSNGFNIRTSDLIYNPMSRELRSNTRLTFTSDQGSFQGIGFSSKLDEQEFRINANVQAKYQPQK